jgi:hypothetical protein
MRASASLARWRGWALAGWCLLAPAVHGADGRVAVVVAAQTPSAMLTLDELAQVYRRRRQFVGGLRVQPINLPAGHALRRFFSHTVLQKAPEEMEDYWRDMYFNGVFPPFVLASEEAVLRFVAATPGAIGYVSACALDRRVTVVLMLDGGPGCSR